MTRILIADQHAIVREGLRAVFKTQLGWEVVGEVADGSAAILKAIETLPDIAVIDSYLPLVNGPEVARQIRSQLPNTEVLIFTMDNNEATVRQAVGAGARGYILKSEPTIRLVDAMKSLANHKPFYSSQFSEALLKSYLSESKPSVLTPRERGVVQLIAEGHSNKQTARVLSISVKTVEAHRSTVMRKLELSSPAALVRYAVRNLLVEA